MFSFSFLSLWSELSLGLGEQESLKLRQRVWPGTEQSSVVPEPAREDLPSDVSSPTHLTLLKTTVTPTAEALLPLSLLDTRESASK